MKTLIITALIVTSQVLYSQSYSTGNYTGRFIISDYQNGKYSSRIITNAQVYDNSLRPRIVQVPQPSNTDSNGSYVRWTYGEPTAIGEYNSESGNGQKSIVGWYLNNQRTEAFGNTNSTPLWTFTLGNFLPFNYVSASASGSNIANGFYQSIYSLNGDSGTARFSFNVTNLLASGNAGQVGITSTGNFIIGTVNASTATDTSYILGFSSTSSNIVWRIPVPPGAVGGSGIQGVKISGNDSLAIINAYLNFWVIKTYTGQIVYSGTVNPLNNNGTQTNQGISGNGNIIATINYAGYVRVYQWNGTTYNFMWQHQEPPGTFYNWMSAVDVSYDGSKVAIGTLQFITSSSYDGKVKLFNVSGGSTPLWTYSGAGDEVSAVSFSKTGKILSACSWGNYQTLSAKNLLVYNTTRPDSLPIFSVLDPGSFFWCSTSFDGTTVLGSGKAVNARQFGSGGMAYNIFVDTSSTATGIISNNTGIPSTYSISQNYPNPFNPATKIDYSVPKPGNVKITVYDIMGRQIGQLVNSYHQPGYYSAIFNGENVASGMYFYKIEASGFVQTKKMILVK